MHEILSNARAMRFWSTPAHTELAQTREWLDDMVDASADLSDDYMVELQGRVVGKAGCWRAPEVGFIFHPDVWGIGIAQETLRAVLPRIFERLGMAALVADVDPRNAGCLRLLGRLGFLETGRLANTWQVGAVFCDSVYLSLANPGSAGRP